MTLKRKLEITNEGESEESPPLKKEKFSVTSFERCLRSHDFSSALNTFIKSSSLRTNERDVAVQFLEGGGQISLLVALLESQHELRTEDLGKICFAIYILITRCQTQVPNQKVNALEACRRLFGSYSHVLNTLLGSRFYLQRKSLLQLLTAIISLDVSLAREILNRVTFTSSIVEELIQHETRPQKGGLRSYFVRFLMEFLVHGNEKIIVLLLEKKGLLASIVPGLNEDNSDLVIHVLTVLRKNLAENPNIQKTKKLHIFNTQVLIQLAELYKWKGPVKERKLNTRSEEEEKVTDAVHRLLMILCSSHKLGVIFSDPKRSGSSAQQNPLIFNFISKLQSPWDHKLKCELVAVSVKSCPDVAGKYFHILAPFLKPRVSSGWLSAVSLAIKIITDLSIVTNDIEKPIINTVKIFAHEGIKNVHSTVSATCLVLIQTVLKKLDPSSYLLKVLPDGTALCKIWASIVNKRDKQPETDLIPLLPFHQHLSFIVDLLCLYTKVAPLLLDVEMEDADLFKTLVNIFDLDSAEDEGIASLQVKVIVFLTSVSCSSISSNEELLRKILMLLLYTGRMSNKDIAYSAQKAIGELLIGCNLISSFCLLELEIWLHCCYAVHPKERSDVQNFLCELMMGIRDDVTENKQGILNAKEKKYNVNIFKVVQQCPADQLFMKLLGGKDEYDVIDFSDRDEISPLLMSAIHYANTGKLEISVQNYLSRVLVHILHLQTTPQQFLDIVNHWKKMPSALAKYLKGWSKTGTPEALSSSLSSYSPESALSQMLLDLNRSPPELEDNTDATTIVLLFRLVVFHIAQLAENHRLTVETINSAQQTLLSLLDASKEVTLIQEDKEEKALSGNCIMACLKCLFRHPVLIHYFSPLHQKKQVVEDLVTSFLMNFLKSSSEILKIYQDIDIDILLRKKFIANINYYIKHPVKIPKHYEKATAAFTKWPLTAEEAGNLIEKIIPIFSEQIKNGTWQHILAKLLPICKCFSETSFVSDLSNSLFVLCKEDAESAILLLQCFYKYLIRFTDCCNYVSCDLFKTLITHKVLGQLSTDLSVILLEHNAVFLPVLTNEVKQLESPVFDNPELLFSLLSVAHKHHTLPQELLRNVYDKYSRNIIESLLNKENIPTYLLQFYDVGVMLLTKFMEKSLSSKIRAAVIEKCKATEPCSTFQLAFLKSYVTDDNVKFTLLVLQQALLQEEISEGLVKDFCSVLDKRLKKKVDCTLFQYDWKPIISLMLKIALSGSHDYCSEYLLTTMSNIFVRMKIEQCISFAFELIVSHSRFFTIILDRENTGMKLPLLKLLYDCTILDKTLMKQKHIPVWLSAYTATLSPVDQILLKLMRYYEETGINLYEYRPFLWGDAAVGHYSVRARAGLSLWRIPQVSVILDLLESELVENTIMHFPLHRDLETNKTLLKINNKAVYDPAFILPLFAHITSSDTLLPSHYFARSGALGIVLASLCSTHVNVRNAACTVLSRYYTHLEAEQRRQKSNKLLLQFIESIRTGLNGLNADREAAPRLSCIVSAFLGRASIILTQPYNSLYAMLHKYFLAGPRVNLLTIPEFYNLLYSDDLNFRTYQYWLLELIRDAMQTNEDIHIMKRCSAYKILMSLFSCYIADHRIKVLTLEIIKATLTIPEGASFLSSCGLKFWVQSVIHLSRKEDENEDETGALLSLLTDISVIIQN